MLPETNLFQIRVTANEAELAYDDIVQKYPQNAEGYWGRLLARYGIKYE